MATSMLDSESAGVVYVVSPGCGNCTTSPLLWRASRRLVAGPGRRRALSSAQPLVDRRQRPSQTARLHGITCFSYGDVPTIRALDLSGLSCRPFCMYHSLTSDVHAASTDRPAAVLTARMARCSCVSSAYWWYCTPCPAMTSPTGLCKRMI